MTHIAGVLVQSRPVDLGRLNREFGEWPGIEVHATRPDGRMVLTIEASSRDRITDALTHLHGCAGVLSACLVYEQSVSDSTEVP